MTTSNRLGIETTGVRETTRDQTRGTVVSAKPTKPSVAKDTAVTLPCSVEPASATTLTYRLIEKSPKPREERFDEIQARIMKSFASTFEKLAR